MIDHRTLGTTGYAARVTRDDGAWTDLHLSTAPTGDLAYGPAEDPSVGALHGVPPLDGRTVRRVFPTDAITPTGELPLGRVPLLFNHDVAVHHVQTATASDDLYVNTDGDELVCAVEGGGVLLTPYGQVSFGGGEYLWIPRGTVHAWQLRGAVRMVVCAFRGELRVPGRWRNALGQLTAEAPYAHRDFRGPVMAWGARGQPRSTDGRWRVHLRRGGEALEAYATVHPLDAQGWEGMVYPVALPWECAMVRGSLHATLFEHPAVRVDARVVRATVAQGPLGEDTVALVVDGEGAVSLTWTPGCVPDSLHGSEGAMAVVVRTRHPLQLTATGAMVATHPSSPG